MQPQNPLNSQTPVTAPPAQPQPVTPQAPYDFIFNPEKPPKKPFSLPGGNSMAKRFLIVAGGLLALLILFVFVKNLVIGKPKLDSMVTVAQDQQELIHLSTNAILQPDLSTTNKNLAGTAQLSLVSAQSQIGIYLKNNHFKVSPKTLNLKLSTSLDAQLTNAETAGTYNQTFQDTMKAQLNNYSSDLKQAYQAISGKKGRALLSSDYDQAQLLLNQIVAVPN